MTQHTNLRTHIGTEGYQAPEIAGWVATEKPGHYNAKCDVWSFGCLLYELLTSHIPFSPIALVQFCQDSSTFPTAPLYQARVSEALMAFLQSVLISNPRCRPNSDQAARKGHQLLQKAPYVSPRLLETPIVFPVDPDFSLFVDDIPWNALPRDHNTVLNQSQSYNKTPYSKRRRVESDACLSTQQYFNTSNLLVNNEPHSDPTNVLPRDHLRRYSNMVPNPTPTDNQLSNGKRRRLGPEFDLETQWWPHETGPLHIDDLKSPGPELLPLYTGHLQDNQASSPLLGACVSNRDNEPLR